MQNVTKKQRRIIPPVLARLGIQMHSLCRLNSLSFQGKLWNLWGRRTEHLRPKAKLNVLWKNLPYCGGKRMYSQLRVLMNYRKKDDEGAIFPLAMNLSIGSQLNLELSALQQESCGEVHLGGGEVFSVSVTAANASALCSTLHMQKKQPPHSADLVDASLNFNGSCIHSWNNYHGQKGISQIGVPCPPW